MCTSAACLSLVLLSALHPAIATSAGRDVRLTTLSQLEKRASRNVPPEGFYDPRAGGGGWLTSVVGTWPEGLGEPINTVLSGHSDEAVLKDTETNGGYRNYILSIGFSGECLGQHAGNSQGANLGDGHGELNETAVLRWNYGDPQLGTCTESIQGGNHFRYWIQNGEEADSGAIFMAASYEKPIKYNHDIVINGYNLGRDWLVGNITHSPIPTANLTNGTTFSGQTSYGGYTYQTGITYLSGYLQNTSEGINHYDTVGVNNHTAVDGLVAVLDVQIVTRPANTKSAASALIPTRPLLDLTPLLVTTILFLPSLIGVLQ